MPVVVVAAVVVAAAATAYSGYAGSRATKEATKAQKEAAERALQFEREKEAKKKADYDAAMAKYRARVEAWQKRRNALAAHYGVTVTNPVAPTDTPPEAAPSQLTPAPDAQAPGADLTPALDTVPAQQPAWMPEVPGEEPPPPDDGSQGPVPPPVAAPEFGGELGAGLEMPPAYAQGATLGDIMQQRRYAPPYGQGV